MAILVPMQGPSCFGTLTLREAVRAGPVGHGVAGTNDGSQI